jgi:hypothetical protein
MTSKLLANQIEVDLNMLKEDINAGVYEQDIEGFNKEITRIGDKMVRARELKVFESEQDLAEA